MSRHIDQKTANAVRDLVISMHHDHVKYPQLRLPEMQWWRLDRMFKLLTARVPRRGDGPRKHSLAGQPGKTKQHVTESA